MRTASAYALLLIASRAWARYSSRRSSEVCFPHPLGQQAFERQQTLVAGKVAPRLLNQCQSLAREQVAAGLRGVIHEPALLLLSDISVNPAQQHDERGVSRHGYHGVSYALCNFLQVFQGLGRLSLVLKPGNQFFALYLVEPGIGIPHQKLQFDIVRIECNSAFCSSSIAS
jgi:hypothetical protein